MSISKLCIDGKEHDFSEIEEWENGGSTKCSKCGLLAIDHDIYFAE